MPLDAYASHLRALDKVSAMARERFAQVYWGLDHTDPKACKDVLVELVPAIVEKYGKMAALVACEYYETERGQAVGGGYRAKMAPVAEPEAVRAKVRYALGHLFEGDDNEQDEV